MSEQMSEEQAVKYDLMRKQFDAADYEKKVATGGIKNKVPLKAEHAARLRNLNDKMQGVQAWVQAVSQQGERRIAELTQEGRELWMEIGKAYDLDITKVNYDLDQTGAGLVAKSMRF